MENTIFHAAKQFTKRKIISINGHGQGLINHTYKVVCEDEVCYVLQKINTNIFKHPQDVQNNILKVTTHLNNKLKDSQLAFTQTLNIISTKKGKLYYRDEQGDSWRMFDWIPGAFTHQNYTNNLLASKAGEAFADFHMALSDLNTNKLVDTIPNFHKLSLRVDQFEESLESSTAELLNKAKEEISMAKNHTEEYLTAFKQIQASCPKRVVHQDTKVNNLLFDKNEQVMAVIDLDTVMPGYVFIDFGDAMRVAGNSEDENSTNYKGIYFKNELFENFAKAYVGKAKLFLTATEIDSLGTGIELLVYEQAIRFLSDYLNGSTYYKVDYPDHNLNRAKNQFTYLKQVIKHREYIQRTLRSLL